MYIGIRGSNAKYETGMKELMRILIYWHAHTLLFVQMLHYIHRDC